MRKLALLFAATFILAACPKAALEQNARDVAASLGGLLTSAQAQHQECVSDSTPTICQTIKRGVSGQNALITSLETYCGWRLTDATPPPVGTVCTPVTGAEAALRSAIANANQLTTEIRGTVKP